jgi:hypothetical protein
MSASLRRFFAFLPLRRYYLFHALLSYQAVDKRALTSYTAKERQQSNERKEEEKTVSQPTLDPLLLLLPQLDLPSESSLQCLLNAIDVDEADVVLHARWYVGVDIAFVAGGKDEEVETGAVSGEDLHRPAKRQKAEGRGNIWSEKQHERAKQ